MKAALNNMLPHRIQSESIFFAITCISFVGILIEMSKKDFLIFFENIFIEDIDVNLLTRYSRSLIRKYE